METQKVVLSTFLDRIERRSAVLILVDKPENSIILSRELLPSEATEGCAMRVTLEVLPEESAKAKQAVQELYRELGG